MLLDRGANAKDIKHNFRFVVRNKPKQYPPPPPHPPSTHKFSNKNYQLEINTCTMKCCLDQWLIHIDSKYIPRKQIPTQNINTMILNAALALLLNKLILISWQPWQHGSIIEKAILMYISHANSKIQNIIVIWLVESCLGWNLVAP